MKYKNQNLADLTLAELQAADWELAGKEYEHSEAMRHPKFEKMKPVPTPSEPFLNLRQEIKTEIKKFNTAGLQIEKEDK